MANLETIHQNIWEPTITATCTFPNLNQTKVSYVPPFNTVTIGFYCNKPYDRFICRTTFEDELASPNHGILVTELDGVAAGVTQYFTIDTTQHFLHDGKQEGGNYHINMYIQDNDTMWNFEYKLLDKGGNQIVGKNSELIYVIAKGAI